MVNEDIIFRTGVDTRPFAAGIRSLNRIAKDAGNSISNSFKDAFKDWKSAFGVGALVGSAVVLAHKLADMADEVKGASEAFGVSTDFIQGWRTAVTQNSGSVEDANKGLEKLSLLIGQNSENFDKWGISLANADGTLKSTQEIILAIADRIKDASSGSERAAIAFDLFGKSGAKLIPTLLQGSEALEKQIESFDKLSPEEITKIADAQDKLNLLGNKAIIIFGHLAGKVLTAAEAYSKLESSIKKVAVALAFIAAPGASIGAVLRIPSLPAGGGGNQSNPMASAAEKSREELEKLKSANDALQKSLSLNALPIEKQIKLAKGELDQVKENLKNLDKIGEHGLEYEKQRKRALDLEKEIGGLMKLQSSEGEKIANAAERNANAVKNVREAEARLNTAKSDRTKFTLQELASNRFNIAGRWDARDVIELERQAGWWKIRGNDDMASLRFNEADKIRSGIANLTERERNPFKSLEDQLNAAKETAKATTELNQKIKGTH